VLAIRMAVAAGQVVAVVVVKVRDGGGYRRRVLMN